MMAEGGMLSSQNLLVKQLGTVGVLRLCPIEPYGTVAQSKDIRQNQTVPGSISVSIIS